MNKVDFFSDIKRGKVGEQIFIEDFLSFLQIKYRDVTGSQAFQIIDADFLCSVGLYEVKTNYRDNQLLVFEDYTNNDPACGAVSLGWIHKSAADLIVFISQKTRSMILLPFTDRFKAHYADNIVTATVSRNNAHSCGANGRRWRSSFRLVSFALLAGFISEYKIIR